MKLIKDVFVDIEIILKIFEIIMVDFNSYVGEKGWIYFYYCLIICFDSEYMLVICVCFIEFGVDVNKKDNDGLICFDVVFKYIGK